MDTKGGIEGVASKVAKTLHNGGHNFQWLSAQTGVPYSTLHAQLTRRPESLTLPTVVSIASALGVSVTYLTEVDGD